MKKGYRIGIVGIGGLGLLAVKMATALSALVVVFTTSADKVSNVKRFGAVDVVVNNDPAKLKQYTRKLDFVLSTVPYQHNMDPVMGKLSVMRRCTWWV
ncbi:MAG: zinc-binding dehydrogenase [Pseudomonas sp.]